MNIRLTPEQEQIVERELQAGYFSSVEDLIAHALLALREKEGRSAADDHASGEDAVRGMLSFVEKNRTVLKGISVKELIHEDHVCE
jgi:Arc/MetJ-type ribon-helix-helix transcriptional regulator